MVLRKGDHGLAVVLLKYRFDTVRQHLYGIGVTPPWGPCTSNDRYDNTMFWNVTAFQVWVNSEARARGQSVFIAEDGVFGDATNYVLTAVENSLGIIYGS